MVVLLELPCLGFRLKAVVVAVFVEGVASVAIASVAVACQGPSCLWVTLFVKNSLLGQ